MRMTAVAAMLAAVSLSAHATGVVQISYDENAQGGFGGPGPTTNGSAYEITTSQTATTFTVDVKQIGTDATDGTAAGPFANLYFGAYGSDGKMHSTIGFEVTNDDVFIPGGAGPFADPVAKVVTSGNIADHDAEISFTLPFSFLETDPLGVGFVKAAPGASFYLTLSQTFGYTVQGGVANFGADDLGKFTIPSAVPEPAMPALLGLGLLVVGAATRRRAAKA